MSCAFIVSYERFKVRKFDLQFLSFSRCNSKKYKIKMISQKKLWNNNYSFFTKNKNSDFYEKTNSKINTLHRIKNFIFHSEKSSSESYIIEDLTNDGGVVKKILITGLGSSAKDQSIVKVHYRGKLDSGIIFDSSYERNEPYVFKIGEGKVIKGWEIGIKSMKVGEKALIEILPNYGYKKKGIPPIIPPNSKLFYEVELLEISQKSDNESNLFTNARLDDLPNSNTISEDFEKKIKKKSKEKNLNNIQSFFFISPFRSQTGEKAPWWLNPNITFVLVFLTVFFLFWIVLSIGGIHQGYVENNFDANVFKNKNPENF